MKFLLDMPVSPSLITVLASYNHEAVHTGQIGKAKATDEELIEFARQEGRIIITADLDFPRLLALSSAEGPGIILFRGGNYPDHEMSQLLKRVLDSIPQDNLEDSICVVDHKRIRRTRLPVLKVI